MTCRDEILAAVRSLLGPGKDTFTIDEVLHLMSTRGAGYPAATIRTHITSRQCTNAPKNHAVKYDDFVRVGPGQYRLASGIAPLPASTVPPIRYAVFEDLARAAMEAEFGVKLSRGAVEGVPKQFDFVSHDRSVVGDAKYYTLVGGSGLPPAKYATIAEYVWLLEKTSATHRFLIFGNDIRVPKGWIGRYGSLATNVKFYFLHEDGTLDILL